MKVETLSLQTAGRSLISCQD